MLNNEIFGNFFSGALTAALCDFWLYRKMPQTALFLLETSTKCVSYFLFKGNINYIF